MIRIFNGHVHINGTPMFSQFTFVYSDGDVRVLRIRRPYRGEIRFDAQACTNTPSGCKKGTVCETTC